MRGGEEAFTLHSLGWNDYGSLLNAAIMRCDMHVVYARSETALLHAITCCRAALLFPVLWETERMGPCRRTSDWQR